MINPNGFLVSKETVVLRRWESETKIKFYQTVKDLESWRSKR